MKCKKCGEELAPFDRFCPTCGNKVEKMETVQTENNPRRQSSSQGQRRSEGHPIQEEKKGGMLLILILAAIALIFLAIIGVLAYKSLQPARVEDDSVALQKIETASDQEVDLAAEKPTEATTQAKKKETTEAKKEKESNQGDYILPDSSNKSLSAKDVSGLSKKELRLARNEIYARHGRKFKDQELQAYFNGKSWYKGKIAPDDFIDEERLTKLERQNIKLIESYED